MGRFVLFLDVDCDGIVIEILFLCLGDGGIVVVYVDFVVDLCDMVVDSIV